MEITEENYELYRKYLDVLDGRDFYNKKEKNFFHTMAISSLIALMIPTLVMMIGNFFNIVLAVFMMAGGLTIGASKEIMISRAKKLIKKECPDFDFKVNINGLRLELSKFEEKSNNPVAMDNRAETSIKNLRYLDEKIDTPEEILNTLKTEKEFWEKVVESEKEKEAVKSKKMC